jgi:hypothetical protein
MVRSKQSSLISLCRKLLAPASARKSVWLRPELELLEDRCVLSTFWVSNTKDSGGGSLRAAIDSVNKDTSPSTIRFLIGNGKQTIGLNKPLPIITHTVIIDGTPPSITVEKLLGAPVFSLYPTQKIELRGPGLAAFGDGLAFKSATADGSMVFGLTIDGFSGNGISLTNVKNVRIGALDGSTIGYSSIINGRGEMMIYSNGLYFPQKSHSQAAQLSKRFAKS